MRNLESLGLDVKTLTYTGLRTWVQKQKGGVSAKDVLANYAERFDVNLEEKKERDILYRRVSRLLNCGIETEEIQKANGKFVCMTAEEAEAHRKHVARLAKLRGEAATACERLKLNGDASITEQHVVLTFAAFIKLAK